MIGVTDRVPAFQASPMNLNMFASPFWLGVCETVIGERSDRYDGEKGLLVGICS